ncbi:hypothetical protein D3C76_1443660 [compost metagenome]
MCIAKHRQPVLTPTQIGKHRRHFALRVGRERQHLVHLVLIIADRNARVLHFLAQRFQLVQHLQIVTVAKRLHDVGVFGDAHAVCDGGFTRAFVALVDVFTLRFIPDHRFGVGFSPREQIASTLVLGVD